MYVVEYLSWDIICFRFYNSRTIDLDEVITVLYLGKSEGISVKIHWPSMFKKKARYYQEEKRKKSLTNLLDLCGFAELWFCFILKIKYQQ